MIPRKEIDGRYIDKVMSATVTLKRDQLLFIERYRSKKSALLMYSVGTGKSLCMMAVVIDHLQKPGINPEAISVILVMKRTQIKDFMTNATKYGYPTLKGVHFTTYQLFHTDYAKFKDTVRCVIVDEMHRFSYTISKSEQKAQGMSLKTLLDLPESVTRIAVTATPMINDANDMLSICTFLTKRVCSTAMEAAECIGKYSAIFSNQTPVSYPAPKIVNTEPPAFYKAPAENNFGRAGRMAALGPDYYPTEIPKDISFDSIFQPGRRFTPYANAVPTAMMSHLIKYSSPIYSRWLAALSESYTDPGMTSIYFDSLRSELFQFARLLELCGWHHCKSETDMKINAPNFLILSSESVKTPNVLYMARYKGMSNADGSCIKLVLFSTAYKEGVSFLNTLRIFTLPVWNRATLMQCLGRSMRTNSYEAFTDIPPMYYLEPASDDCFHSKRYIIGDNAYQIRPWIEINTSGAYHETMEFLNLQKEAEILPVEKKLVELSVRDIPTPSIPYTLAYCPNTTAFAVNMKGCDINHTIPRPKPIIEDTAPSTLISYANQLVELSYEHEKLQKLLKSINENGINLKSVTRKYMLNLQSWIPDAWSKIANPESEKSMIVNPQHEHNVACAIPAAIEVSDSRGSEINKALNSICLQITSVEASLRKALETQKYIVVKYIIKDRCVLCGMQVNRVLNRDKGPIQHSKCIISPDSIPPMYKFAIFIGGVFRPFSNLNSTKAINNGNPMLHTKPIGFDKFMDLRCSDYTEDHHEFPLVEDTSTKR